MGSADAASGAKAEAAASDPVSDVVTREDLNGLQTDLENFKYQWQREIDLHTGTTTRSLKIGGLAQARAGGQDNAVNAASVYERRSTFELGAAQLFLTGNLFKDYAEGRNLTYSVRFGSSPQGGNSYLNVQDANLTYSILPTVTQDTAQLSATLGQQQLPFGLESAAPEELKPVIRTAQFSSKLGLSKRDIGLVVKGDVGVRNDYGYNYRQALVAWSFGAVNGAGPNAPDDNGERDYLGRVTVTVPSDYNSWLRQLTFGASGYVGRQNRYGYVAAGKVDPDKKALGLGRKNRFGADVYYNHHPFGVTYEFVRGFDGVTDPTTTTIATARPTVVRSESHVGTAFFSVGEQFLSSIRNQGRYDDWWPKSYQFFVRVDLFDPNVAVQDDRSDVYTVGLNVFFAQTTKFQVNYSRTNDRRLKTNPVGNEILAQFQYGW